MEQFFKEKAGEYSISYREEDWNRMAGMLALRDARIAYRRRVIWIAAASLLAVSLLGYFTFENYNRINQLARMINDIPVEETTPITGDNDGSYQGIEQPSTDDQDADRMAQIVPGAAGDIPDEQDSVVDEGIAADGIIPDGLPDIHDMLVSDGNASVWEGDRDGDAVMWAGNKKEDAANGEMNTIVWLAEAAGWVNDLPPVKDSGIVTDRMVLPIINTLAADTRSRDGAVTLHPGALRSRISATLQLSPDMSTAGSVSNFSSPGYKTGITVQYRISRKWSVSTGVIRSEVRYSARARDYDPPVYWPSGGGPEHMSAVCLLIDIPVSLRYDVLQFGGSRFFATAGLSSYIMLNEEYTFLYDGYAYGQLESWSGRTGTRHWLSNAGFSVGYELIVHPNWSLLAEPFIAVPLREVGWGNVRLYSAGSYLSVRYRFGS